MQYHTMPCNGKHKNQIFGLFFGQKGALATPLELAQQHEQHENVVFLVMMVREKFEDVQKKFIAGQKTAFTSGYGGLLIQLSWVCLSQKK